MPLKSNEPVKLQPENWVNKYADAMLNFAYLRISNRALAEDLVQDTFVAALKSMNNFKGNSLEKTWLYAILENKINDYFRSSNYRFQQQTVQIGAEFFDNYFEKEADGNYHHWQNDRKPHDWQDNDQNALENQEFYKTLYDCLHKLPQKIARVFTLKNMEDYDTPQICKELDISTTNYWVMIHRAKLQLRECLEKNWFND